MNKTPLKNGDIVTGFVSDYTFDGFAILKTDNGNTIFVPSLVIGEQAEVMVNYVSQKAIYGQVLKINKLSLDRIQPRCPIATACGGCQFQHLNYQAQLAFKKKKVADAFHNIAHFDPIVNDVIGMENPYFYRNKTQMPFGFDNRGQIISGFYRAKTHDIIKVKQCMIESELAGPILTTIRTLMSEYHINPYDEDRQTGIVRHVLIRTSHHFKHLMVVFVVAKVEISNFSRMIDKLVAAHPEITTVVQNINMDKTNVILGHKEKVLFGPGYIKDRLFDIEFRISPKSFYQINPTQTEKLYQTAIDLARFTGQERVLDAYSGIGSIGLSMAKYVKEVVGVELVEVAVKDANMNAKRNKIDNAHFYTGDAGEFLENVAKRGQYFDVVIMDPPRRGASSAFVNSLLKIKPAKIIYISCDPATMARDIDVLKSAYQVGPLQPVDMFPHTYHVETVVQLQLKDK